jgi:hypothetical protein
MAQQQQNDRDLYQYELGSLDEFVVKITTFVKPENVFSQLKQDAL